MRLVRCFNVKPEQAQAPPIDHRHDLVRLDVERNVLPSCPSAVEEGSMIEAGRLRERSRDYINRIVQRILTRARHSKVGNIVKAIDVVESYCLQGVGRVLVLVHLLLEFLENLRSVRPLRLDEPILRVEEDLARRLPNPV